MILPPFVHLPRLHVCGGGCVRVGAYVCVWFGVWRIWKIVGKYGKYEDIIILTWYWLLFKIFHDQVCVCGGVYACGCEGGCACVGVWRIWKTVKGCGKYHDSTMWLLFPIFHVQVCVWEGCVRVGVYVCMFVCLCVCMCVFVCEGCRKKRRMCQMLWHNRVASFFHLLRSGLCVCVRVCVWVCTCVCVFVCKGRRK